MPKSGWFLAGTALALGNVAPAFAQIEDIVVTARKRAESLQDVPVAAFAVTAADLERNAVTDLTSASKLTPGLIISKGVNNGGATIFLRGVGSSPVQLAFDQAVLINVDNIPISKGRAIFETHMDMEQIEVLKGPQALFFGKNATAGIISVQTKDPGDELEVITRAGYNFEGRGPYAELVLSSPLSESLGVRLATRYSKLNRGYFENISESIDGIPNDRYAPKNRDIAARATIAFDPGGGFENKLKVSYSNNKTNDINGMAQLVACQGPNGTPQAIFGVWPSKGDDGCVLDKKHSISPMEPAVAAFYPEARGGKPYNNYESIMFANTMSYDFGNVSLTAVTGYYDFNYETFGNFDIGTANVIFGHEFGDYRAFTQEVRLASDFDGPLNFTVGAFFDSTKFEVARGTALFKSTLSADYDPDSPFAFFYTAPDPVTGRTNDWVQHGLTSGKTYSAFADINFKITPDLELAGGARFTREVKNSLFNMLFVNPNFLLAGNFPAGDVTNRFADNNVSPAVSLSYRPTRDVTLFAAYRTGYKSGGANIGDTFVNPAKFGYDSEKAEGFEIGAKSMLFDRQMRLNMTAYRYTYKNLQVGVFDPVTTGLPVGNAGEFRTTGIEIDMLYQPQSIEGLALRGALAYNKADYTDYIGACYAGQSFAAGCNQNVADGVGFGQDYSGRPRPNAPRWNVNVGGNYDRPVSSNLNIGFNVDARYVSSYFFGETLSPFQKSDGYWNVNATLRLYQNDDRWELALIGTNLFDTVKAIASIDNPGTGGGTGTAAGIVADTYVQATTIPREIALQATFRF